MPTSDVMIFDPRPIPERPDDAPYLWLAALDVQDAVQRVDARTKLWPRYGGAAFAHDRDITLDIFDRPDRIPYVPRYGGLL